MTTPIPFRRIALIAKPIASERLLQTLRSVEQCLRSQGYEVRYDPHAAQMLQRSEAQPLPHLANKCDVAVVVGGDGTLLSSARDLVDAGIPLLGINLGRLGFLVDISPDGMLDVLTSMLGGSYQEEQRFLLRCQVGEQPPQLALNDVVVHKWNSARMIELETWIDARFVNSQNSDGMIISTPTGSTAYALSGGGPLLTPSLDAIALVPICPHTLSNRPIVVPGGSDIRIVVSGKTEPEHVRVTCDGQISQCLANDEQIVVLKHPQPLRLLHPTGHDHYQLLRAKLGWGEQPK